MAIRQDFEIDEGADFSWVGIFVGDDGLPVDLSGWSARWLISTGWDEVAELVLISTVETAKGSVTVDAGGVVTLEMSGAATGGLDDDLVYLWQLPRRGAGDRRRTFRHQLELIDPDGVVTRWLHGSIFLERSVADGADP